MKEECNFVRLRYKEVSHSTVAKQAKWSVHFFVSILKIMCHSIEKRQTLLWYENVLQEACPLHSKDLYLFSGGSRISPGGGRGRTLSKWVCQPIFFVENCMKMKEFRPPGGVPGVPLDPPMLLPLTVFYVMKLLVSLITTTLQLEHGSQLTLSIA